MYALFLHVTNRVNRMNPLWKYQRLRQNNTQRIKNFRTPRRHKFPCLFGFVTLCVLVGTQMPWLGQCHAMAHRLVPGVWLCRGNALTLFVNRPLATNRDTTSEALCVFIQRNSHHSTCTARSKPLLQLNQNFVKYLKYYRM
jgi:hypothetical protein